MSAHMWLAHVGFYEYIGLIADGVFRIHGLYVAALCAVKTFGLKTKSSLGLDCYRGVFLIYRGGA